MATPLKQSYDWCYRVARKSGSSFYRAFWLLEKPQRIAMFALYAFARITDDLSDSAPPSDFANSPPLSPVAHDLAVERLSAWRETLTQRLDESSVSRAITAGDRQKVNIELELRAYDPLWPALRDTVMRYSIPPSLLQELVDGVTADCRSVRFENWEQVDAYAYQVASTVGLACTRIWQAADTLPKSPPIDCGIAFQLTNILRDLREDALRGRIYLPMEELRKFGCDEQSWLACQPGGDWPALVSSVIQRARSLYHSGKHTIDHLPKPGKRIFGLMWKTYYELLNTVEQQQAQLWSDQRIGLTQLQRLRLLFRAVFRTPNSSNL